MPPYYRQLVREKCALWIAKRAQPTSIFEKQTELCEIVQVLAALPPCKYTGEDHHQLKEEMDSLAMRNMKRVAHCPTSTTRLQLTRYYQAPPPTAGHLPLLGQQVEALAGPPQDVAPVSRFARDPSGH